MNREGAKEEKEEDVFPVKTLLRNDIKFVGIGIIYLSLFFLCGLCGLCGLIIPKQPSTI
ncbi:hypothetical protein QUB05_09625 [Microcoleus sp. F10-C6]|uniref:hypothetical protein n=1 Tax=unclassified Microcoleus TaxID=2642155 RepID=UPI002FD551A0